MNTTKFSNILLDKAPKKINNNSEKVLDILFNINEVVREINSIDFCNPLGYILTKALPPEGLIDNKLKQFSSKVNKFISKQTEKLEFSNNTDNLANDIEELRISLEELIPDQELKDIIPGGDSILRSIQGLNDSLVITNTLLNPIQKKRLIKSFTNRLIPFSNPISLTEVLLKNQAEDINKRLTGFIKPERFRQDLLKLIRTVISIDKSISLIQASIILINKIIKSINVLIKITKITIKILKKTPVPAMYVTVGVPITISSNVSKFETLINDLQKLLSSVSYFITNVIVKQIRRIRREIFILLIGLNQLYENLSACDYFNDDQLLGQIQKNIDTLNNNIIKLDELFPEMTIENSNSNIYKGYNIVLVKEETSDNNTILFRRRVIVTNSSNIMEYESTPTYTNDDQILIKEGQFYIDTKFEINTTDTNNNNITDEEAQILINQSGYNYSSEKEINDKEIFAQKLIQEKIDKNPEDKKIFNLLSDNLSQNKIEQVKRIVNSLSKIIINPTLLKIRLEKLSSSLIEKGYTLDEIQKGFKSKFNNEYSIIIENNNIKINNRS